MSDPVVPRDETAARPTDEVVGSAVGSPPGPASQDGPPSAGPPASSGGSTRAGAGEGGSGLPLTERLRLAREAASAKAASETATAPSSSTQEPSGPPTDESPTAAGSTARNPKFPPPLAMLLGRSSPAPNQPTLTGQDGHPTGALSSVQAPSSSSYDRPAPAPFKQEDDNTYHNYGPPPPPHRQPADLSLHATARDDAFQRGPPHPPKLTPAGDYGDHRDELNYHDYPPSQGETFSRPATYDTAAHVNPAFRARDPRADLPAQGRPARSPEPRAREDDRRRIWEGTRDPREDRDRDGREPRDGRDRARDWRRDNSPRRSSHGQSLLSFKVKRFLPSS